MEAKVIERQVVKLINKTSWDTSDLRAIVNQVLCQMKQYGWGPEEQKRLILTIVPARQQRGSSGFAYIRGRNATVRIPTKPPGGELTDHHKISFARVTAHECAHILGHRGERWMRRHPVWGRHEKTKEIWGWAANMPIRRREKKKEAKPNKSEKIGTLLATWERKLKLAHTKVKKYRRQLNRLQKKAVAT